MVQKNVIVNQNNEDFDKTNVGGTPNETVQEYRSNLAKIQEKFDRDELDIFSPVVTKITTGDNKVYLDQKYAKLIDRNVQDSMVDLDKTNEDQIFVELPTDDGEKVLVNKSQPENIILEFDKHLNQEYLSHLGKPSNKVKIKSCDQICSSDKVLSEGNLTKVVLDTMKNKKRRCKIESNQLFKVTVKCTFITSKEVEFVVKQKGSGIYELVFDKEFEKWYTRAIKEHHSEDKYFYTHLFKTDSGHFIMDIDQKNLENNAVLTKSDSGNIKVIVSGNKSDNEFMKNKLGFAISPISLINLLNKHIDQAKNVINTGTITTYNEKSEENSCAESKCTSDSTNCESSNEWSVKNRTLFRNQRHLTKELCNEDPYDDDLKPHIVIKPCGCHPALEKSAVDGSYNVVQSVCPYHIDRYDEVSNDILEISGLCQRTNLDGVEEVKKCDEKKTSINVHPTIDTWDSLEFFPPQLPPFLKDYSLM